jgi:hypothetical protein
LVHGIDSLQLRALTLSLPSDVFLKNSDAECVAKFVESPSKYFFKGVDIEHVAEWTPDATNMVLRFLVSFCALGIFLLERLANLTPTTPFPNRVRPFRRSARWRTTR